jgi:DNA-binding PadR family transcriptional regulator
MAKRFFRHGELHLVILTLVARQPMHGYQLMGELTRLFGPAYRPSAGSIYPAVEGLEAEGLITGRDERGRRVYELSATGAVALDDRADRLAALEVRTGVRLAHRPTVEAILARFTSRVHALGDRIDPGILDALLSATADDLERRTTATAHPSTPTPTPTPTWETP